MAPELVAGAALKGWVNASIGEGCLYLCFGKEYQTGTLSFCLYHPGLTLLEESKGLRRTE